MPQNSDEPGEGSSSSRIARLVQMEPQSQRQSELRCCVRSPAETGEAGIFPAHNLRNRPSPLLQRMGCGSCSRPNPPNPCWRAPEFAPYAATATARHPPFFSILAVVERICLSHEVPRTSGPCAPENKAAFESTAFLGELTFYSSLDPRVPHESRSGYSPVPLPRPYPTSSELDPRHSVQNIDKIRACTVPR